MTLKVLLTSFYCYNSEAKSVKFTTLGMTLDRIDKSFPVQIPCVRIFLSICLIHSLTFKLSGRTQLSDCQGEMNMEGEILYAL